MLSERGNFKDMMHGYWVFVHFALVVTYGKRPFVPIIEPESCTFQFTECQPRRLENPTHDSGESAIPHSIATD